VTFGNKNGLPAFHFLDSDVRNGIVWVNHALLEGTELEPIRTRLAESAGEQQIGV
jgi:hypothetical protein